LGGYVWGANFGWISLSNAVAHVQSSPAIAPPPGLVAWWPANNNAVDVIGGNNGTLENTVTYVPGEVQQAFNFNSDSAMVLLANTPALQLQNFTIEAWIQRNSLNGVTLNGGSAGNALMFGYGASGYSFGMSPNGNPILTWVDHNDVVCSMGVTDTNWHHVAVTTTNGSVIFYIDGMAYPVAGNYNPGYTFATAPAIGARADNLNQANTGSFLGSIDELSVYNVALTPAQILTIYDAGAAGKYLTLPSSYDLVAGFSTNNNPNGVWSYGWATSGGSPFQLMASPAVTFLPGDSGWTNGEPFPNTCYIDRNFSGSPIQDGTVSLDPDTLHMQPLTQASIARFTAPVSGAYQVAGLFRLQDTGTQPHNLSIRLNAAACAYFVYTSGGAFGEQYPFSFPCALSAGQTIDFIVSYVDTDGNLETGLKATVTPLTNTVYSAVADFSTTANPNGVWSYVYWPNNNLGANAQLLFTNVYPVTAQSNIFAWWDNGNTASRNSVIIADDDTGNSVPETGYPNVIYYPDTLFEGPQALPVATRFTAPATGSYVMQGFFRVQDSSLAASGNSALVEVITNANAGSPEFSANTQSAPLATQYPFTFTNLLTQGETVDFATVGANGHVNNLSTGVNVYIIPLFAVLPVPPVPPLLQSIQLSGGNLTFTFQSVNAQSYTVQTTTNLSAPNWVNLGTVTGTGAPLPVSVPVNNTIPEQFYRLNVP